MLRTFCKGACAVAAVTTLWTGAALADFHSVLIVEGSFFPSTIYVRPGDQVTFTNQSDETQVIFGAGDSWTSGPIESEASYRLDVDAATPLTFANGGEGEALVEGTISFEPALLND